MLQCLITAFKEAAIESLPLALEKCVQGPGFFVLTQLQDLPEMVPAPSTGLSDPQLLCQVTKVM